MSIQAYNLTPLGLPRRWNGMCPACWALWKDGEPVPSDCDQCGPAWSPAPALGENGEPDA